MSPRYARRTEPIPFIGPNGERRCPECEYQTGPYVPSKCTPGNLRARLVQHMVNVHDMVDAREVINKLEREAVE